MKPLSRLRSRTFLIRDSDVDTDQILPARYLTAVSREGMGEAAFADWRFDADGRPRDDCELNHIDFDTHAILVAGHNFGCGSSREHAAWALLGLGVRAVISTSLADIFRTNAIKNGLLAIEVDADVHRWLMDNPGAEIEIDLEACEILLPTGERAGFPIDRFGRYCLMNGTDELGFLLELDEEIHAFEAARDDSSAS